MKETFPETLKEQRFRVHVSTCSQSCPATRTGNQIKYRRLFFLTGNLLITSSTLRFLVLWMCNNDTFDNLSSPIVALRQFFMRCIALNERSLDANDTGIVINTVKIALILWYKSWFVTLSVSSNVCGFFPSTIFQRVFHLATSSRNVCLSPISV